MTALASVLDADDLQALLRDLEHEVLAERERWLAVEPDDEPTDDYEPMHLELGWSSIWSFR